MSHSYLLAICFAPSLVDSNIFLTLTRLVVVIIFENYSFALFTPPSRRLSDVVETKDLAEGRDSLGHGHVVGLPLLVRLGKCLGGLTEGRLELCKQPKQKSSNTS